MSAGARERLVEQTAENSYFWITLGQSFTILLLVGYIFWLFRQRNDRLEISVNIVTQLANSYLYTRSRAMDAISRHNRYGSTAIAELIRTDRKRYSAAFLVVSGLLSTKGKTGCWLSASAMAQLHRRITWSLLSRLYGYINLGSRWRNDGVSLLSFSEYDGQQRTMLLLSAAGEFATAAGVWHVSDSGRCELLQLRTDREYLA